MAVHQPMFGHHPKCYSVDNKCYCTSNNPFVLPSENVYEAKYAGHGPKCYLYDGKCYCASTHPYVLPPPTFGGTDRNGTPSGAQQQQYHGHTQQMPYAYMQQPQYGGSYNALQNLALSVASQPY